MKGGEADPDRHVTAGDARASVLALLGARASNASVCPSEVARALVADLDRFQGAEWLDAMPMVHQAVDQLVAEGLIRLSWKGELLTMRAGPYRIRRA